MKKFKGKLVSLLVVFTLICSVFSNTVVVFAEGTEVKADTSAISYVVNTGKSETNTLFEVPVTIKDNSGFAVIEVTVNLPDSLEYVDFISGNVCTIQQAGAQMKFAYMYSGMDELFSNPVTEDGTLFTLTLKVAASAISDTTAEIGISTKAMDYENYPVTITSTAGSVAIIQSTDVKSIAATGTIYYDGSTYKAGPDFKVTATLYDDTTKDLSASDYQISGNGETATITYNGTDYVGDSAPTTTVTATAKAATSISLNPTTVSATVGSDSKETVASKVKYTATYNDGTTSEEKQVTADMLGDLDLSSAGQKTVTVTAEGQTAELTVDVAEHKHMPGAVQGVNQDPTCTEPGSMQYWECNICHQKFSDEACTQPIETEIISALGHQLVKHDEVAATCTTTGTKEYWECTRDTCGKLFSDAEGNKEIVAPETIAALGHALEKHEKVPATCTEAGTKAYWECTRCGKLFSDEAGNSAIEAPESIAALGHNMTHHEAVASTCKTHGTIEYWSCDRCNKNYTDETGNNVADSLEAPLAAHTLTKTDAKEPTTTVPGNIEYWTCSVCDKLFKDEAGTIETTEEEVTIPVHVHSMTQVEEKPATCTEAGTEAYWKCEICSKMFSDEQGQNEIQSPVEIPALGHNMTHYEAVASTCEKQGNIEYWHCSQCNLNYSDENGDAVVEDVMLPLAAHSLTKTEAQEPTATEDGNIAYWTCSVCNKTFSDENGTTEVTEVTVPALGTQVEEIIDNESIQLTVEDVTEEAAVASLTDQFNKALRSICEGYTATVNVAEGGYVAPVAGTAENPKGTPGSITYTVTITKDDDAADTTTTDPQTLAIAAKEYVAPSAPTYTITVNGAYADKKTAKAGETVTVTAPYKFGYTFVGWKTSSNLTLANRSPVSFVMPDGNVTIEPVYTYTPVYYPPVDYYPPVITKPVTKPEKVEDGWHDDQYYQDGEPVVGWLEVTHGQWYYFDRSGSMMTGWVKVDGTWYYMLDSGVMATGWVKVDGNWYFLKNSGAMATGWLWDNGHWYYLSGSGAMKTGWVLSGSKWYYLNAGGAMVTGWVEWKGDWYYMNTPNGDMAVDTKTPDGYYVNSDGIWVK